MTLLLGLPLIDTPLSSLMDSLQAQRLRQIEVEGVGARSLVHNTSGVEGHAGDLGWGLERLTSKSIIHMDLHKPNNKLVNA
jgi:hypothetical protein